MKYYIYKATAPNGKYYIGVTNNFKRRLKEHCSSKYPFGCALRKHGKDNFKYLILELSSVEEALSWEEFLVQKEQVESDDCYNISLGGVLSNTLVKDNPMHRKEILEKHPNLFTSTKNPMNNPESKSKMVESQECKQVYVNGKTYYGVREAARSLNISRQCLIHRLKSDNFQESYYL